MTATAIVLWVLLVGKSSIHLGYAYPSPLVAIVTALIMYLGLGAIVYFDVTAASALSPYYSLSSTFFTVSRTFDVLQLLFAASLFVLTLLFRARVLVQLLCTLAAGLLAALLFAHFPTSIAPDPDAARLSCRGNAELEVCTPQARAYLQNDLADAISFPLRLLAGVYDPPITLVDDEAGLVGVNDSRPKSQVRGGQTLVLSQLGAPLNTGRTTLPPRASAILATRLAPVATEKDLGSVALLKWLYERVGADGSSGQCNYDCLDLSRFEDQAGIDTAVAWLNNLNPADRKAWMRGHAADIIDGRLKLKSFASGTGARS